MTQPNNNPTQPNNNPTPKNTAQNTGKTQTLMGGLVCFISSSKILGLLQTRSTLGNCIVVFLLGFAIFSIFERANSKAIDARSMCEKATGEVASQLGVNPSEIVDFSSGTTSSAVEKQLFFCDYSVQQKSKNGLENSRPSTERYHIVYQVLRDEWVASVREEKITKDILENICYDETIYTRELLAQKQYNPNEHEIIEEGLELQSDPNNTAYPVFRWKCKYRVVPNNQPPQEKPGARFPSIYMGLDLDAYCQEKFGKENLTKARYHYYNDPNSLYCIDPNF
jgi:hypothetical protein